MCNTTTDYNNTTNTKESACFYCGFIHTGICPRVEEIEYYPNGSLKRVKFREDETKIIWSADEEIETAYDQTGYICGVDCPQNYC